ncbi:MAG: hypothetical protein H7343_18415 [Undibacterium sp.]|nr:hypothetical protein [Opitutaceae bacterium]
MRIAVTFVCGLSSTGPRFSQPAHPRLQDHVLRYHPDDQNRLRRQLRLCVSTAPARRLVRTALKSAPLQARDSVYPT